MICPDATVTAQHSAPLTSPEDQRGKSVSHPPSSNGIGATNGARRTCRAGLPVMSTVPNAGL